MIYFIASRCIPHKARWEEGTWEPSYSVTIKTLPYSTFHRTLEALRVKKIKILNIVYPRGGIEPKTVEFFT